MLNPLKDKETVTQAPGQRQKLPSVHWGSTTKRKGDMGHRLSFILQLKKAWTQST